MILYLFQNYWFNPSGSKCGRKAAGKIEYRLEYLRRKGKIHKNQSGPRKTMTVFEDLPEEMVSVFLFQIFKFKILHGINFSL